MSANRSRPFVGPPGQRIVGDVDALGADLGMTSAEVTAAITAAGLDPWGLDAYRRPVWRLADVKGSLGRLEPSTNGHGSPWRSRPIIGTAGAGRARRTRQGARRQLPEGADMPAELLEAGEGPDGLSWARTRGEADRGP